MGHSANDTNEAPQRNPDHYGCNFTVILALERILSTSAVMHGLLCIAVYETDIAPPQKPKLLASTIRHSINTLGKPCGGHWSAQPRVFQVSRSAGSRPVGGQRQQDECTVRLPRNQSLRVRALSPE